jgi:hypothetical protein
LHVIYVTPAGGLIPSQQLLPDHQQTKHAEYVCNVPNATGSISLQHNMYKYYRWHISPT